MDHLESQALLRSVIRYYRAGDLMGKLVLKIHFLSLGVPKTKALEWALSSDFIIF